MILFDDLCKDLSPDNIEIVTIAWKLLENQDYKVDDYSIQIAKQSAMLLAKWNCPITWIAATLITPLIMSDNNSVFSVKSGPFETVVKIAQDFSNLNKVSIDISTGRTEKISASMRRLRLLFIASYLNESVVFIAISQMIGTLEIIDSRPGNRTLNIQKGFETELLPLLELFGLWNEKNKVTDRIGAYFLPVETKNLQEKIQQHENIRQELLLKLRTIFKNNEFDYISAEVRRIRPYRVLQQAKEISLLDQSENVLEWQDYFAARLAFNITVKDTTQCYLALKIIHNIAPNIPGKFKDYISTPKFNGYQMIHTAISWFSKQVEFYIGTEEMLKQNQLGRIYENQPNNKHSKMMKAWWNNKDSECDLLKKAKPGEYSSPSYVFSPIGQLYKIPIYSTPVDFAYLIHSDLGQFFQAAEVNGVMVNHNYELSNADIVKIKIDPNINDYTQSRLLQSVKTPYAAKKIRNSLSRRYKRITEGHELIKKKIEEYCSDLGIKLSESRLEGYITQSTRWFKCDTRDSLFLEVRRGTIAPDSIANNVLSQEVAHRIKNSSDEPLRLQYRHIRIARCCHPSINDKIIGRFSQKGTRHESVKVHKATCKFVQGDNRNEPLFWSQADYQGMYEYLIHSYDRREILRDILSPFYETQAYLHKVRAEGLANGTAQFIIYAEPNNEKDNAIIKTKLNKLDDILDLTSRPLALSPEEIAAKKKEFRKNNPFSYDTPVWERENFCGRSKELDEIKDYLQSEHHASSLILYGPYRIGKTSILKHIEAFDIEEFNVLAVYFNLHQLTDPSLNNILSGIAEEISRRLEKESSSFNISYLPLSQEDKNNMNIDSIKGFIKYIERIYEHINLNKSFKIVVMIDEFSNLYDDVMSKRLDNLVFKNLRYLFKSLRDVSFILVVQATAINQMASKENLGAGILETSEFVRIGSLDRKGAYDLVEKGFNKLDLSFTEEMKMDIVDLCGRNPYLLNILCNELVRSLEQEGTYPPTLNKATNEIIDGIGHVYFMHLSNELVKSDIEQKIMKMMTNHSENDWVSLADISNILRTQHIKNNTEIASGLSNLVRNGFLEKNPQNDSYKFLIPLLKKWLAHAYQFK